MGLFFSRLFSMFGEKEARILVLGLDNAGKTTILYRLQVGTVVSTIPTIGFNVENGHPQQRQIPSLGSRRSNLHPPVLAMLLPEHPSNRLRRRLRRRRTSSHNERRIPRHLSRGGVARCRRFSLREQTRFTRRLVRSRSQRRFGFTQH